MTSAQQQKIAKAAYMREWRKRRLAQGQRVDYHKEPKQLRHRRRALRKYGMTPDDYNTLLLSQGVRCAACRQASQDNLHVDHDHETGRVRGLLCRKCNVFLGMVGDDPSRIRALIEYIRR